MKAGSALLLAGRGGGGVGRKPVWREVFANLQSGVSLALMVLCYEQCRSRLLFTKTLFSRFIRHASGNSSFWLMEN